MPENMLALVAGSTERNQKARAGTDEGSGR